MSTFLHHLWVRTCHCIGPNISYPDCKPTYYFSKRNFKTNFFFKFTYINLLGYRSNSQDAYLRCLFCQFSYISNHITSLPLLYLMAQSHWNPPPASPTWMAVRPPPSRAFLSSHTVFPVYLSSPLSALPPGLWESTWEPLTGVRCEATDIHHITLIGLVLQFGGWCQYF